MPGKALERSPVGKFLMVPPLLCPAGRRMRCQALVVADAAPGYLLPHAHSVAQRVAVSSGDFYPKSPVNIKNIIHGSAVESFRK